MAKAGAAWIAAKSNRVAAAESLQQPPTLDFHHRQPPQDTAEGAGTKKVGYCQLVARQRDLTGFAYQVICKSGQDFRSPPSGGTHGKVGADPFKTITTKLQSSVRHWSRPWCGEEGPKDCG